MVGGHVQGVGGGGTREAQRGEQEDRVQSDGASHGGSPLRATELWRSASSLPLNPSRWGRLVLIRNTHLTSGLSGPATRRFILRS
ncbi:MAG: hypothetical protein DHS20C15_30730 [Planctomycetota bacterium]|nr:MAG: hypothetical protein DHS20C15_30730 [Planctomycetota bacterium]